MGASWFSEIAYGKTLRNAYEAACKDAEDYSGHQEGYNGTISTTYGVTDLTQEFKRSRKDITTFINSQADRLNKRECAAVCVQEPVDNKNKTRSQVEHIVTPGTKKWILKYFVYADRDTFIGAYLTKGEAVTKARAHTEKTQDPTYITMEKVLDKGNKTVARVTYKKSTTERPGKYILFGWAAE